MTGSSAATPQAVSGPTVWSAADLADRSAWTLGASAEAEADLIAFVEGKRGEVELQDAPALCELAMSVRERMFDGPGFVVLNGLPLARDDEDTGRALVAFCRFIGTLLPQTLAGSLLDRVRDEATATVRGAKTNRALVYHTDFATSVPDVFALMAVRSAKEGGESMIASSHTIHNVLFDSAYEALAQLYGPFCFDRTGDVLSDTSNVLRTPVFRWADDTLLTLYNRARIHRGFRQAGEPMTADDVEALDALDDVLDQDQHALTFVLEPGEVLFANNRVVFHNRKAFEDFDEQSRARLLLRVWLGCPQMEAWRD